MEPAWAVGGTVQTSLICKVCTLRLYVILPNFRKPNSEIIQETKHDRRNQETFWEKKVEEKGNFVFRILKTQYYSLFLEKLKNKLQILC